MCGPEMIVNSPEYWDLSGKLSQCEIFSPCSEEEMETLLHASYCRRVFKNKCVFSSDEVASDVYLLLSGGIKLCSEQAGQRPKVLQIFYPTELFGLFDLLTDGTHDLSALALTNSDILVIDGETFLELLNGNARVSVKLLSGWGIRFREFSSWCFRYNHYGAREKVAAYLISETGDSKPDKVEKVMPTRRDIASLLGITPETLSRELSYFKKRGWVRVDNGGVLRVSDSDSLGGLLGC